MTSTRTTDGVLAVVAGDCDPLARAEMEEALRGCRVWRSGSGLRRAAREAREIILVFGSVARRGKIGTSLALLGSLGKCRVWEPRSVLVERARSTWFRRPGLPWWQMRVPAGNRYDEDVALERNLRARQPWDPLSASYRATPWDLQPLFLLSRLRWPSLAVRLLLLALYHLAFWPLAAWGAAWGWFHRGPEAGEARRHLKRYVAVLGESPGFALFKALEGACFAKVPLEAPSVEIGVGDGRISRLHFHGKRLDVGLEYLEHDLRRAWERPHVRLPAAGSAYALPLRDASVETLVSVHTIDHLDDLRQALREMARITRPGGTLHVSGPTSDYARRTLRGRLLLRWRPERFPAFETALMRQNVNFNFHSLAEWRALLEEAGFRMEAWQPFVSRRISTAHQALSNFIEYALGDVFLLPRLFPALRLWQDALVVQTLLPWFLRDAADGRRSGGVNFFLSAVRA